LRFEANLIPFIVFLFKKVNTSQKLNHFFKTLGWGVELGVGLRKFEWEWVHLFPTKERVLARTFFTPNFAPPLGDELGAGLRKFQLEWVSLILSLQKSEFWRKKKIHPNLTYP